MIDIDPYYLKLGETPEECQKRYRQNVEGIMKEKFLQDVRKKLDEGVFGSIEFIKAMKEKLEQLNR